MDIQTMLLNQMANSNPQLAKILKEIKDTGKNPKDLFYEKAKMQGVNPDEVLKVLQNFK